MTRDCSRARTSSRKRADLPFPNRRSSEATPSRGRTWRRAAGAATVAATAGPAIGDGPAAAGTAGASEHTTANTSGMALMEELPGTPPNHGGRRVNLSGGGRAKPAWRLAGAGGEAGRSDGGLLG